jgi:hypothetical protein
VSDVGKVLTDPFGYSAGEHWTRWKLLVACARSDPGSEPVEPLLPQVPELPKFRPIKAPPSEKREG